MIAKRQIILKSTDRSRPVRTFLKIILPIKNKAEESNILNSKCNSPYLQYVITLMCKYFWLCCLSLLTLAGCSFTQKVQTGLQAYEVKQYSVAAQLFEKEFEASHNPTEK